VPSVSVCILQILLLSIPGSGEPLHVPLPSSVAAEDVLQYDDGTVCWLECEYQWRGVWFTVQDFDPMASSFLASATEFWFYHSPAGCWDNSTYWSELWTGGSAGPETLIDSESAVAAHMCACYVQHDPGFEMGTQFWVVMHIVSSGTTIVWPSNAADGTPSPISHSFKSDDFQLWEPFNPDGPTASDYMFRVHGTLGLQETTWGAIKTLF